MFWKIVNKNTLSLSLVNRMIILYSFTTIFIVVFVCIILFPSFEKINHVYNTSYQHNLFSQCIIKLIIALLFGMISAVISAVIIARRSTKQIYLLSEQVKNINIDSLTNEIKINNLPKELKPLGESFNIMLDKLKKSFSQISQFSSDIAHELRTPIHNLLGMNEIALTHQYTIEKSREIFESNLEECRSLSKLIENLWFIANSDHGYIHIDKIALNARKELFQVLDYYEPYANENKVKILCEGDALIFADSILFKRAISNILSNALKYTFNGKINIKIEKSLEYTSISIHDTGSGIDKKHISKLFDRFYRVDPSRSLKTGGLGLGLAIVKSIMDLHQGKIEIQSHINVGTSVFLYFPNLP